VSLRMPPLQTDRLLVRDFSLDDVERVHEVMIRAWQEAPRDPAGHLARRHAWIEWSIRGYEQYASISQPPYGERAIALRAGGLLVGSIGVVPSMGPFGQLVTMDRDEAAPPPARFNPEVGLYWAVDPAYGGRGNATEAARAVSGWLFTALNLARIIATTEYDNAASQAVMRKLGMHLMRNPYPDPAWFQAVGLLRPPAGPAQ